MNSVKTRSKGHPPDGGYGWVVVAAGAVCCILIIGLARVSGLVFLSVINKYNVSRTEVSVVFVLNRLFSFAGTPLVSSLVGKYTYCTLVCIGTAMWSGSLFLSGFTSAFWQFIITYGFLLGIGTPFTLTPITLIVGIYFKKKRALAMSILFATGAAGGFVLPPLFDILLENYGLNGALLIYSAVMLNGIPCAMLIHDPTWLPAVPKKRIRIPRKRNISEITNSSIKMEVEYTQNKEKLIEKGSYSLKNTNPSVNPKLLQRMTSQLQLTSDLFKDAHFILLLTGRVLTLIPLYNLIQFIPDFIRSDLNLGLAENDIAFVLSAMAIGDTLSRLSVGTVIAKLPCQLKYSYIFWSFMSGAIIFCLLVTQSYIFLLLCNVIFGLTLGTVIVTQFIIEAELMGPEKTPWAHGLNQAISGTISVIFLILVGYIRDITGSYKIGFLILGSSGVSGGLIWLLEPCLVRCLPPRIIPQPSIEKFPDDTYIENAV